MRRLGAGADAVAARWLAPQLVWFWVSVFILVSGLMVMDCSSVDWFCLRRMKNL
jgi:hypothetical protein